MPSINLHEINWLAVIVAGLATFMLGGLWYGPLFSKAWIKSQGWTEQQVAAIKAAMSPPKFFGGMILSYLVLAFVLAILASAGDVDNAVQGLCLGGLVWLFVAAVTMTHHLASAKFFAAYIIDVSYEFIYFMMMGAIIGGWR